jgi:hypothetical protein
MGEWRRGQLIGRGAGQSRAVVQNRGMKAGWVWAMAFVAMGLTGCSSFHKEWQAATAKAPPANSIEGAWSGQWQSEQNGHHGSLRCVISKSSDTTYRAHFRAKYLHVLRFTYVATLNGYTTNNNTVVLRGESKLPKYAGGLYTYEGTATPIKFESTYANKYDHGRYEMARP